jgi:hypothetical protein
MVTLRRELRTELENAVTSARREAVKGARKAIEALAVQNGKPWQTMSEEQKQLRNRLRAHGRQLGDVRNQKQGDQSIEHLVQECAYEHWHRMLFARFLAECDLLIEPESGMSISLAECRELAMEQNVDWLTLASQFAVKMLSQIFRAGDPVLEVILPLETRQELEGFMKSLPREVFLADDSLGWVYQFWQAEEKKEVNDSGEKIGADELAPVTQLFTEDYMVFFLLHNTLGAWWAGKVLAQRPDVANTAKSEEELRAACAIGDVSWEYLRFVREGEGPWRPAAGTFNGWPQVSKELKVLDPCMGSGHFLVFVLPILLDLRMAEDKLSREAAAVAVLRDNLFGLELDNRCTQIAAFNLALTVWRMTGHQPLPPLNLTCSGLGIHAKEKEWVELAGNDQRLRDGMSELYNLFKMGPVLGSLINPRSLNKTSPLLIAEFQALKPLLQAALEREESRNYEAAEMAIAAEGMTKAAEILAGEFNIVATNVPYLGRGKQDDELKDYCDRLHPKAKGDLATCFVERCLDFCSKDGSTALVTTQYWLFLTTYKKLRESLLKNHQWDLVARLGTGAFATISGEVVNVALLVLTNSRPTSDHNLRGLDVSNEASPRMKAVKLAVAKVDKLSQRAQLSNPNSKLVLQPLGNALPLETVAIVSEGLHTGDYPRFGRKFWELPAIKNGWAFQQGGVTTTQFCSGMEHVLFWEGGNGQLISFVRERLGTETVTQWIKGDQVWGKSGISVGMMGDLKASMYQGSIFTHGICAIVPKDLANSPALRAFCESEQFCVEVRKLDQKVCAARDSVAKVPFDLKHWQRVAAEKYPSGLPEPFSSDATQWLFNGHPNGSEQPLHVAIARLLGYRWPRQTGSSFPDCPEVDADSLVRLADADGIVCLDALQGELPAAERLRALLAAAYGSSWSHIKQTELLDRVGAASLDQWLREKCFEQHCSLFHNRPFIWHIWDGLKNGFNALVNYHSLAAPNGEGRRTLEKLIFTYLGDWIKQQRDDQANGVEGADARVAAAEHLKRQLEAILHGEPPYDVFVRWKALAQQPIGWDPDINDGVRLNIRPFMTATPLIPRSRSSCILRATPKIKWEKDRGKEPYREKDDFPWFWSWDQSTKPDFAGGQSFDGNRWNDLHYSPSTKQAVRDLHFGKKEPKR